MRAFDRLIRFFLSFLFVYQKMSQQNKRSLVQPSQSRPLLCDSILNKNNHNRPKSTDSFLSENYNSILKLQKVIN
jgi:hypothetical protein